MIGSKKKILVVDDQADMRVLVSQVCENAGYTVFEACDGLEGLELAHTKLPDLIVCDVSMPGLDGIGLIKKLRETPGTASIPFIFLTGKTEMSDLRAGMQLGADDYITKPFAVPDLLAAVEVRLGKKEAVEKQIDRRLNEMRVSILDSLPHELRTPLHGILGFAEILKADARQLESAEIEEIAARIHKSAVRLHRLMENFLLYADLVTLPQKQQHTMKKSQTASLRVVAESAARDFAARWKRASDLQLDIQDCSPAIAQQHLIKIVEELVDNALKFSEPNTTVRVGSRLDVGSVTISVGDAGRGMSPDQVHNLGGLVQFDRPTYEQQGMGMGFTVARRLAELYGGSISVESGPGKGTTVAVTLPTTDQ